MKFPWTKTKPSAKRNQIVPQQRNFGYTNGFAGGNVDQLKKRWWIAVKQSPDNKVLSMLKDVRYYSQYLHDNDAYMAKYRALLGVYVVGENGLRMQPLLTEFDKRSRKNLIENIKTQWKVWGKVADIEGKMTWADIERLVLQNTARDGEIFIRYIVGTNINKFGFALQLIAPENVDEAYNGSNNATGNRIHQGIEVDRYNRPIAYWIWNDFADTLYPSQERKRERIDASEIIHLYEPANSRQSRGLPWTAAVIQTFARFHEYKDSTLQAAQMASNIPLIIKTTEARAVDYMNDPTATNPLDTTGNNQGPAEANGNGIDSGFSAMSAMAAALGFPMANNNPYANISGVNIMELPPNKDAVMPNWNIPNQMFDRSTKIWLHEIATGLGVSYTSLTSDGADENYSSGRLNSIVERNFWEAKSAWFIRNLHEKVYAKWIEVQCNMPKAPLKLPTSDPTQYLDVEFSGPSFEWVDPLKDAKAYVELRNMNWMSDTSAAAALGYVYTDELQKIADDIIARDALGIAPPVPGTQLQVESAIDNHVDKTGNAANTSLGDTTATPANDTSDENQ